MNPISKTQSFSPNECELKPSLSEENVEVMVPKPLECLNGTQISPFLSKTFDLVNDTCYDPIVSWGSEGVSFVIWDPLEFSKIVLPRNFKHNNFSSFVRQLNTYGFRKIHTDRWEFANEGFVRGKRHLLKRIQRKRSAQAQPIGSSIELGKNELHIELEELKKQKILIMAEVAELQKQQDETAFRMELVNEKLSAAEQRQKKMVSFLVNLFQNRQFLSRLGQMKEQKAITVQKKVKKFLKLQKEPDLKNITTIPEFSPSSIEEISEFLLEHKADHVGPRDFVPRHIESVIGKGKNVANLQAEADPTYLVSSPEELGSENNNNEVSSVEMGTVVKQEALWNLDFEDGVGMSSSSTDLLGSSNNYDDMVDFGFKSSLSDVWDLDSWAAYEYPSYDLSDSQNYDDPKTIP